MRIGAVSSFSGKGRNPAPAPTVPDYEQLERNIPDLLALWPHTEDSGTTLTDVIGGRNGTISGTVTFNAPDLPPESSGGSIDYLGTGTASVPHDSGFALPALTIHLWAAINDLPPPEIPAFPILSKDADAAGSSFLSLNDDGTCRVRFRESSTVDHDLDCPTVLEAGSIVPIGIRADNTGFDCFIKGIYQGKHTGFTGAWSANTAALAFADNPFFALDGNIKLAHVALYSRALTDTEMLTLAQNTALPVANDDTVNVPESATTDIDVLANDIFVGTPTIVPVSQPSGGDSWSVVNQKARYVAGAVAANTGRSFQYNLTDPNGASLAPATVRVTVLNSGAPAVGNANCYTENTNDVVVVSSMAALQSAIDAAPPGRTILLAPDTYTGGTFTFNPRGTPANPIVVRPQGGTVNINSANWTLATGSSRLVLSRLALNNPNIAVNGSQHRITRCTITNVASICVSVRAATDLRVDHNDVTGYSTNLTPIKRFISFQPEFHNNGSCRRCLMDYNYVHDVSLPASGSNAWVIHNGSGNATDVNPGHIIDHMLVRNFAGQGEFINIKVSGYIVRFSTFENIDGYLQQRQGGGWEIRSCWFEDHSGGFKCFDSWLAGENSGAGRQLVIGNRLIGVSLWVGSGSDPGGGDDNVVGPAYHRSRLGRFIGNKVDSQITVGQIYTAQKPAIDALNNNLWNNTVAGVVRNSFAGGMIAVDETGTTFNSDAEAYDDAVKLTPSGVGVGAPDPLCLTGPQS